MTDLLIRPGRATDAAELVTLFHQSRAQAMPWLPVMHTPDEDARWMAEIVLGRHTVWVAESAGTPVGFAAVDGELLGHLYVRPGWQRQGIGSVLLDTARAGLDRMELWVFQRNVPARSFYERHGFVVVEETDGGGNEERTPDARYEWQRSEGGGR